MTSAVRQRGSAVEQVVERALLRIDGPRASRARAPTLRPVLNDVARFGVALSDAALNRFDLEPGRVAAAHDGVEDSATDRNANNVARSDRIKSHAGRS